MGNLNCIVCVNRLRFGYYSKDRIYEPCKDNRAYHVMTTQIANQNHFAGSELNATDLAGIKKTEETDPKNGAIRAAQLVFEGV
jgi:hypothetical protein